MSDDPGDTEGGIIDLSGLTLRDLDEWGDSSLLRELRRVLGPNLDDHDAVAGWGNSV